MTQIAVPGRIRPRDGDQPGQVLARYREADSWRAVVRYNGWTAEGWPMTHEMPLPASHLGPR